MRINDGKTIILKHATSGEQWVWRISKICVFAMILHIAIDLIPRTDFFKIRHTPEN